MFGKKNPNNYKYLHCSSAAKDKAMRRRDFFANVWNKIDLSEKKRLMSQVKKKYGNNHSEEQLYRLLAQEYQDAINASIDHSDLKN